MDSARDHLKRWGFPIRISPDQRSFATPRSFSQRTTSFIASRRQGIHQTPLSRLILLRFRPGAPWRHAGRRPVRGPTPVTRTLLLPAGTERRPLGRARTGRQDFVTPSSRCHTAPRARARPAPGPWGPARAVLVVFRQAPRSGASPPGSRPAGSGGGGRDRTDDLLLAKQALSRLSYAPVVPAFWWAREDLNLRPHAYQARALTN
jgi:hypothetical protein